MRINRLLLKARYKKNPEHYGKKGRLWRWSALWTYYHRGNHDNAIGTRMMNKQRSWSSGAKRRGISMIHSSWNWFGWNKLALRSFHPPTFTTWITWPAPGLQRKLRSLSRHNRISKRLDEKLWRWFAFYSIPMPMWHSSEVMQTPLKLRHADQIGISVIMIGELLAGFAAAVMSRINLN